MININEDNKKFAESFIEKFIERIQTLSNVEKYTEPEIILYISEIIGTEYESENLINYCNILIENTVRKIENNNLKIRGMYSDFGIFTFAVNNILRKTKNLSNLSYKLNTILLDYANLITENQKQRILFMSDYDCISGVSGILYYLLHTDFHKLDKLKIRNLIEFLINCTKTHEYKNYNVINFHLENDALFLEEEKERYHYGNINFGLAHGMSGPLIALLKVFELELYSPDILKVAINKISGLYKKYEFIEENIPYYPRQLDFNDYILENNTKDFNNASWCYGNISNALVLLKTNKFFKDGKGYKRYENYLLNIINQNYEDYFFEFPVLCHGSASIIAEQISLYETTRNKLFLNNMNRNLQKMKEIYLIKNNHFLDLDEIDLNSNKGITEIQGYKNDLSFLCGVGGIFLVLLDILVGDMRYKELLMIS